jgi:hypothetical protein
MLYREEDRVKWSKQAIILFMLVGFLWLNPPVASAQSQPAFDYGLSYSAGTVKAVISATQLTNVYAFHLHLSYDESKLAFKQAASKLTGFSVATANEPGKVEFAFTKIGPIEGMTGAYELVELTFDRIALGSSQLALDTAELVDSKLVKTVVEPALSRSIVQFIDLSGHWAENAVYAAVSAGFVKGYPDATFKPDANVTRAEFAVMLAQALGLKAGDKSDFKDDSSIAGWARGYVAAAAAAGWINGYADGSFKPNQMISREEMAVIIARAGKLTNPTTEIISFTDAGAVSAWAKSAVAAAYERGLLSGMGNHLLQPQGNTTRAQAVSVITRLVQNHL